METTKGHKFMVTVFTPNSYPPEHVRMMLLRMLSTQLHPPCFAAALHVLEGDSSTQIDFSSMPNTPHAPSPTMLDVASAIGRVGLKHKECGGGNAIEEFIDHTGGMLLRMSDHLEHCVNATSEERESYDALVKRYADYKARS